MSGPHSIGDHLVDLDWLQKNHTQLHPFGLGFLQLKLNETERIHFWHPGFVREREEVHNHRYDFMSTVLRGEMQQSLYVFKTGVEHPTHELFETDCAPGQEGSQPVISLGLLSPIFSTTITEGNTYRISHEVLHRIDAKKCVTFLRRESKVKSHASVVRDIGGRSICPFAEDIPAAEMWAMIEDCLK
jgi:hypothetical protein